MSFYFKAEDPFEKHKFIEAVKFVQMVSTGELKIEETE